MYLPQVSDAMMKLRFVKTHLASYDEAEAELVISCGANWRSNDPHEPGLNGGWKKLQHFIARHPVLHLSMQKAH